MAVGTERNHMSGMIGTAVREPDDVMDFEERTRLRLERGIGFACLAGALGT